MNPPDLGKLMEQAQQIQSRMNRLQSELAVKRFEAGAGGGMATAVVSGQLRVLEVRIEDSLFESGDKEMVQDLCAAAVNAALHKAQQYVQEQMQQLAPLGGLPNPFGGAGGGAA